MPKVLHFHGNGGIGAFEVRTGDENGVDVGGGLLRSRHRLLRRVHGHFREDRGFVVRTLAQAWCHDVGIDDARLVHHVAGLDTGGLDDEVDARLGERLHFAAFDRGCVLLVMLLHIGVEGLDEFLVTDGVGRRENARPADDDFGHCSPDLILLPVRVPECELSSVAPDARCGSPWPRD